MKSYHKLSKEFYIVMFTEYLAYELYLDQKYHKKHNNTVKQVLNTCLDGWVITADEKDIMIENALKITKNKYNISI